jgi:hypothetical protein
MVGQWRRRARAKPDGLALKSLTMNESWFLHAAFSDLNRPLSGQNDTLSRSQTGTAGEKTGFSFPLLNPHGIPL